MEENLENSAFDRILGKLTPEKREQMRKDRLEQRASLSLAYQLGYYVGEEIVSRHLPTLSVDGIQTNKNISVTCAEGDECRRLNNLWFSKVEEFRVKYLSERNGKISNVERLEIDNKVRESTKEYWEDLRAYHKMLEDKYLPKTVECHFQLLNIPEEHMSEFKKGLEASLWDCDCSHYSTNPEDIEVKADDDGYFTTITLKKD